MDLNHNILDDDLYYRSGIGVDIPEWDFDDDYTPETTGIALTPTDVAVIMDAAESAIDGTTFRAMTAMHPGTNTVETAVLTDIIAVLNNSFDGEAARLATRLEASR